MYKVQLVIIPVLNHAIFLLNLIDPFVIRFISPGKPKLLVNITDFGDNSLTLALFIADLIFCIWFKPSKVESTLNPRPRTVITSTIVEIWY